MEGCVHVGIVLVAMSLNIFRWFFFFTRSRGLTFLSAFVLDRVGKATHPSHTEGRTECDHRSVGDNVVQSQNGVRLLGH